MLGNLIGEFIVDMSLPIYKPCPNQICLLKGMLNFDNFGEEGWQRAREIIKKGNFKSQVNNFRNYLRIYIDYGVVEERTKKDEDSRYRPISYKQYRIKPDIATYYILLNVFGKRYDLTKTAYIKLLIKNLEQTNVKNMIMSRKGADYMLLEMGVDSLIEENQLKGNPLIIPLLEFHIKELGKLKSQIQTKIDYLKELKNKTIEKDRNKQ